MQLFIQVLFSMACAAAFAQSSSPTPVPDQLFSGQVTLQGKPFEVKVHVVNKASEITYDGRTFTTMGEGGDSPADGLYNTYLQVLNPQNGIMIHEENLMIFAGKSFDDVIHKQIGVINGLIAKKPLENKDEFSVEKCKAMIAAGKANALFVWMKDVDPGDATKGEALVNCFTLEPVK